MAIELLEAARSGTADYQSMTTAMDQAIAKVVLGQLQTSETQGGQYKSEIQMQVRQELVSADADLICGSFNLTVGRWLTEWNYPGATPPIVSRSLEEPEDLSELAERDERLAGIGFRRTLRQVQDDFGGEWVDMHSGDANPSPEFAEGGQAGWFRRLMNQAQRRGEMPPVSEVAAGMATRLEREAAAANRAMLATIRRALDSAESLPDFEASLQVMFAELPTADYAAAIRLGLTAAELAGRFGADIP